MTKDRNRAMDELNHAIRREVMATAIYMKRNGSGCKPWGHLPVAHKEPYWDDADAAISALEDQGLKIVPVEPTDKMKEAGRGAMRFQVGDNIPPLSEVDRIYAAMLNAAAPGS